MNFLNIKYFIAIAEEQNISAAARKLYVSQQSLSEHLKKLETEIGAPLFIRGEYHYPDSCRRVLSGWGKRNHGFL